jgi:nitrate/TMAO reductase-like tetraheme cytochrome c subunit
MILSLGTGTVLAMGFLFFTYQFGVGPQGLKANVPTLSAALGVNRGCVECHEKKSPGVVKTYHDSKHSSRGVQCLDCHKPVAGQQVMTKQHEKVTIVAKPTPKNCARCHSAAVKEFA